MTSRFSIYFGICLLASSVCFADVGSLQHYELESDFIITNNEEEELPAKPVFPPVARISSTNSYEEEPERPAQVAPPRPPKRVTDCRACCPSPCGSNMPSFRSAIEETAFFVNGEFLYWKVEEGELDFAVQGVQPPLAQQQTVVGAFGDYTKAFFQWKPGFRIDLGYRSCMDFWDIDAQYTFLFADGKQSRSTSGENLLEGTFPQNTDTELEQATSDISLHYNVGDLFLARRFNLTPHMIFRLQTGLVGAYIKQEWDVSYFDANDSFINNHWDFRGGGLRAGFELEWYVSCGFGILTRMTGGLLYGTYKNTNKETVVTPTTIFLQDNVRYRDHRLAGTFQVFLGPSWGMFFKDTSLKLYLGYELNAWFNLQEVYRFPGLGIIDVNDVRHNRALLGLQGLTTGFNIDF
jgi:hypothetical protein